MLLERDQLTEELEMLVLVGDRIDPLQPGLEVADAPVDGEQLQPGELDRRVLRIRITVNPEGLHGQLTHYGLRREVATRLAYGLDPAGAAGGRRGATSFGDGLTDRDMQRIGVHRLLDGVEERAGQRRLL